MSFQDTASNALNTGIGTALTALNNLSASYDGLLSLFSAICYVGGFFMMLFALNKMRDLRQHESRVGVYTSFVIAVALLAAPETIRTLAATIWGGNTCSQGGQFIDYVKDSCLDSSQSYLKPVLQFIVFYGFFAFIRGMFLINRGAKSVGNGNAEEIMVKGSTHVLFGILCIHIVDTLSMMAVTFGFTWMMSLVQ